MIFRGLLCGFLLLLLLATSHPAQADAGNWDQLTQAARSAAAAGDLETVRRMADTLDARRTEDAALYIQCTSEIAKALQRPDITFEGLRLIQDMLERAVGRAPETGFGASSFLTAVPYLLSVPPSARDAMDVDGWRAFRRRSATIILKLQRYYQDVEAGIPEDIGAVFLNIAPPGNGIAGVAPEAIADPEQRKQYEAALAKNGRRAQLRSCRQFFQNSYPVVFVQQADAWLEDAYASRTPDQGELRQLKQALLRRPALAAPGTWLACGAEWRDAVEAAEASIRKGNLDEARRLMREMAEHSREEPVCLVQGMMEIAQGRQGFLPTQQEAELAQEIAVRLVALAPELGFDAALEMSGLPACLAVEPDVMRKMGNEEWRAFRRRSAQVLLDLLRYYQQQEESIPPGSRETVYAEYYPPPDPGVYDPLMDRQGQQRARYTADMAAGTPKGLLMRKLRFLDTGREEFAAAIDCWLGYVYTQHLPDSGESSQMRRVKDRYLRSGARKQTESAEGR